MDNQFYVHLHSDASNVYFESNKPYEFTCVLPEELRLQGRWYVSLVELEYSSNRISEPEVPLHLAIYSDICQDSIVSGSQASVLRYLPYRKKQGRVFENPGSYCYLLVNKQLVERISISIKTPGIAADRLFNTRPSRVTLHFSKAPPLVL